MTMSAELTPLELVPVAERPALQASDSMETEEQTIWFNPFDYPVAVQVHVGSEPLIGNDFDEEARRRRWHSIPAPRRRELQTGIRTYVIPAKSQRALPSEFDMGIQRTECMEPECLGHKLYCRNRAHTNRIIVGGSYPRLINKGTRRVPLEVPPKLHPALDEERARAAAALEQSKKKLAEARDAQDMALIAHADLVQAQQDISAAEKRLADQNATAGVIEHQKKIIEALTPDAGASAKKPQK